MTGSHLLKKNKIRDLLKDIHGKHRNNSVVKRWVGQVREVAYDAEDIIDSYIFNIAQQRGETSAGFMRILRSVSRCITDIPAIHQVGKKISDIERRLNEILSNRPELGIDNISASGEASSSSDQTYTWREKRAPIAEEADVIGVEDETKTLVGWLIEGDAQRAVISITRMGRIIFLSILKSLGRNERETAAVEDLCKQLYDHLEGKKYLVVIDDIWTRDAWNGFVSAFPDRQKGSRVVLTTRNEEIAKYADAQSTPHKMHFLAFKTWNSEIKADDLIKLWIAEGFVQQRGEEELEYVAEDYLDELVCRSMIQVARRKSNGTVENCRIHYLLRDLSISGGKEERFLDVHGNIAPT
ncbi:disease resistance protein RPP13-like [Magnolia sinica]|uniref:disease resistance protein RPP13-like n=1 Tax=Magnolia sinica TaxID=86752 RepID=UPI00265B4239|nr:disease resistance protein RPP13-like [Magnolia sinica]